MRKIRTEKDEDHLYDVQFELIHEKHGKRAALKANYGWYVDEHVVQTKVYINPRMVLTSYYVGNRVVNVWSEYAAG